MMAHNFTLLPANVIKLKKLMKNSHRPASMNGIPWSKILLLIIGYLLNIPTLQANETWIIASETTFYPYNYWHKGKRTGMDAEIVEAILKDLNVIPQHFTASWPQVVAAVQEGQCDMAYQFSGERDLSSLILVGPFRISKTMFIAKAGQNFEIASIKDLENYTVGTVEGYIYSKEFDHNPNIRKKSSSTMTIGLRRLIIGRVDLMIGDLYNLKATANLDGKLQDIQILPWVLNHSERYFAFPLNRRENAEKFRASFEKLKQNGTISKIIKKWESE
jgi:polar amino acid transport system substrate-binding protein